MDTKSHHPSPHSLPLINFSPYPLSSRQTSAAQPSRRSKQVFVHHEDTENEGDTYCEQVIRGENMQSTPPDVDILRRAEAVLDLEPLGKACAEELVKASGGRLQRNTPKNKRVWIHGGAAGDFTALMLKK